MKFRLKFIVFPVPFTEWIDPYIESPRSIHRMTRSICRIVSINSQNRLEQFTEWLRTIYQIILVHLVNGSNRFTRWHRKFGEFHEWFTKLPELSSVFTGWNLKSNMAITRKIGGFVYYYILLTGLLKKRILIRSVLSIYLKMKEFNKLFLHNKIILNFIKNLFQKFIWIQKIL